MLIPDWLVDLTINKIICQIDLMLQAQKIKYICGSFNVPCTLIPTFVVASCEKNGVVILGNEALPVLGKLLKPEVNILLVLDCGDLP